MATKKKDIATKKRDINDAIKKYKDDIVRVDEQMKHLTAKKANAEQFISNLQAELAELDKPKEEDAKPE